MTNLVLSSVPLWVPSPACTFTVIFALFGSLLTLGAPWGWGLGLAPWPAEVLDGALRPPGGMTGTGSDPPVGSAVPEFLPFISQARISFLVVKDARRWKEGWRVFSKTRSIQISFSSVFPMLNPPGNVATVGSQEPGYPLLGRGVNVWRSTGREENSHLLNSCYTQAFF